MKKNKLMNLVLAGTIVTSAVAYTSSLVEATTSTGVDIATQATSNNQETVTLVATYKVPVASLTSGAPLPAVKAAFSKAFGDEVIVEQYSDGTYKAIATLQHMEVDFINKFQANITSITEAKVLTTKTSKPGVDDEGEANITLPPIDSEVEVPEKVEFDLKLDENNKQILEVTVDFMNELMNDGEPYPTNIILELSMDKKVELTDKELLKAMIDQAKAEMGKGVTIDSACYVQNFLDEANRVYENESATQQQIDEATQKLKNAIPYLVRNINEGTYTINGSFVKENSDEESMANNALKNIVVKVSEDQTYVELEVQPMSMYGVTATIDKLEIQSAMGDHYEEAKVLATDENGAPSKFGFVLPLNRTYTTVQFTYMGTHSAVARLKLDLDSIVEVQVDKTALKNKIGEGNYKVKSSYTEESYQALQVALEHARTVLNNENATQEEVDQEVKAVQAAIDNLVARPTSGKALLDEDGTYEVPVYLWNASSDKASMAASALKANAIITVKDGKKMMTIYTTQMTMGTISAYLQEFKVKYGDTYQDIQPASYDENGNPTSFTFELPHTDEYILVKMNPHVAMMGNMDLDARIKVDYDGLKAINENDNSNSDQKDNQKDQTTDSSNKTDTTTKTDSSTTNDSTSTTKASAVDTGDYNSAYVMMALAGLSVTGAYALVKTKKED